MITMGLDISATSTGAVVFDSSNAANPITMNIVPTTKGWERTIEHYETFTGLLMVTEPCCAFIEDYAHGARGNTNLLAEVGTIYRYALHEAGIPFTVINPRSLKKFVAHNGNAEKLKMASAVGGRWRFSNKSHDVVDAYALARVGCIAIERQRGQLDSTLSKGETEVLDLIDIPSGLG